MPKTMPNNYDAQLIFLTQKLTTNKSVKDQRELYAEIQRVLNLARGHHARLLFTAQSPEQINDEK